MLYHPACSCKTRINRHVGRPQSVGDVLGQGGTAHCIQRGKRENLGVEDVGQRNVDLAARRNIQMSV